MAMAVGQASDRRITERVLFMKQHCCPIPHLKTLCASMCVYVFVCMEIERDREKERESEKERSNRGLMRREIITQRL